MEQLRKPYYRRSRLLLSSLRAHISEIISAEGAHISSLASLVFGTSANFFRKFPKTFECFRTLPSASARFRTHLGRSEQVRTGPNTSPNLRKLRKTCENFAKTSQKLRERCVRAVVVSKVYTWNPAKGLKVDLYNFSRSSSFSAGAASCSASCGTFSVHWSREVHP